MKGGIVQFLICMLMATSASAISTTEPADRGPDVVVMKELEALYEPVPFDHRGHAKMAEMWDGCKTCHHREPQVSAVQAEGKKPAARTQEETKKVPACKSCHQVGEEKADIKMPNLKGAYHRQCLNCHKEWMHGNACVICHQPHEKTQAKPSTRSTDDIMGRMHPPIPEPENKVYKARFTPAVGANVLFRHKEHTNSYGLKCANCHHQDSCGNCHDGAKQIHDPPMHPGRTWKDSHAPCVGCHVQERCVHCHYKDDQSAPKPFVHASTGQTLDKDHEKLTCGQCHATLRVKAGLSCGGSECHKDKVIAYPAQRPGPFVARAEPTTKPIAATRPSVQAMMDPIALPATKPAGGKR